MMEMQGSFYDSYIVFQISVLYWCVCSLLQWRYSKVATSTAVTVSCKPSFLLRIIEVHLNDVIIIMGLFCQ